MDKREVDAREHDNYHVQEDEVSRARPFDSGQVKMSLLHITADFLELFILQLRCST